MKNEGDIQELIIMCKKMMICIQANKLTRAVLC